MEITTLRMSKLNNGETLSFLDNTVELIKVFNPDSEPLPIAPLIGSLEESVGKMKTVYHLSRKSEKTEIILILDKERGDSSTGIKETLRCYATYHYDDAVKQAAQSVLEVFERYGKRINTKNYQEETITVSSLVDEIEKKSELVAALALLHLTDWFNRLKTKNESFRTTYIDRDREATEKPKEKFADLRIAGETAYKDLTKKINAYAEIEGGVYNEIITQLNAHIDRFKPLTVSSKQDTTGTPATEVDTVTEVGTDTNSDEDAGE